MRTGGGGVDADLAVSHCLMQQRDTVASTISETTTRNVMNINTAPKARRTKDQGLMGVSGRPVVSSSDVPVAVDPSSSSEAEALPLHWPLPSVTEQFHGRQMRGGVALRVVTVVVVVVVVVVVDVSVELVTGAGGGGGADPSPINPPVA